MTNNKDDDIDDDENEFMVDSDDSTENQKAPQSQRNKPKVTQNVSYKRNTLKFGKVRKYKYLLKNIGSLYIASWVREEAEKDMDLFISSSNFKRDFSKRKLRDNQYYQ